MEIFKEFRWEAAHKLPEVPEGHQCGRVHGHSFVMVVRVVGRMEAISGWVMDFADIKAAVNPIVKRIDHQLLNEIAGLENPTSENLAIWMWQEIKPRVPGLVAVEIRETCTAGCIYRGEDE